MSTFWQTRDVFHFDAGDAILEGRCFGPPPEVSPTLVLLHEGLGSISLWKDFPEQLVRQSGWGVFIYSRLGYGGSDPVPLPRPLDYMNLEASVNLPIVLDKAGLNTVCLIGHSDGASIASIYAGSFCDHRLRGIVLLAPHFFAEQISVDAIAKVKKEFDSGDLKIKLSKYHKDVDGAFRGWSDTWLDPDFLNWNIEKLLAEIQVPVLAVQGKEDQYGTMAQMAALRRQITTDLIICPLEGCGHSPHLEKPAETLTEITGFISKYAL